MSSRMASRLDFEPAVGVLGLRPEVASAGDLVRMLEAHGAADPITMETMRRVVELDRGLGWDL